MQMLCIAGGAARHSHSGGAVERQTGTKVQNNCKSVLTSLGINDRGTLHLETVKTFETLNQTKNEITYSSKEAGGHDEELLPKENENLNLICETPRKRKANEMPPDSPKNLRRTKNVKALKVKSVRAKRSSTQDMLTKMNRNILKQFRKINNKIDDTNTKINKIREHYNYQYRCQQKT